MKHFRWALPLIVLFALAAQADPIQDGFFQYTDDAGVVSLTDDVERIPARYQDQAVQRTWAELGTQVETKWTPQSTDHPVHLWTVPPSEPQRARCTGHTTITDERVQVGVYNRRMFTARDECGRTISVTPQRPRLLINR